MENETVASLLTMGGFFISIVGLFIWNRSESRTDMRHMQSLLTSMNSQINAIQSEIKDFHGRLCAIEERNRK